MTDGNLIAALDLGSTRTCAVIARVTGDSRASGAKILGVGISRETGVRRGVVRDIDETTRSIVEALRDPAEAFVVGVQWHPEWMGPAREGRLDPRPLLEAFLGACEGARLQGP